MTKTLLFFTLASIFLFGAGCVAGTTETISYSTFTGQDNWSIDYPKDWNPREITTGGIKTTTFDIPEAESSDPSIMVYFFSNTAGTSSTIENMIEIQNKKQTEYKDYPEEFEVKKIDLSFGQAIQTEYAHNILGKKFFYRAVSFFKDGYEQTVLSGPSFLISINAPEKTALEYLEIFDHMVQSFKIE